MYKCVLGGVVAAVCMVTSAFSWNGTTDEAAWEQLTNRVSRARAQLDEVVALAKSRGLNTDYAQVSQVVLDRFETFSRFDRENPDLLKESVSKQWWAKNIPGGLEDYHLTVPFVELEACLEVADYALNELRDQLTGDVVLQDPVDFTTGAMKLNGSYYELDGKTVFPSSFTWMPDKEDLHDAFGRMGGVYYSISNLKEDGALSDWTKKQYAEKLRAQTAKSRLPHVFFIGHHPAGWMKEQHPEIETGGRFFTQYDIDSPLIRGWLENLFEQMLPGTIDASGDQPRIHLLSNEPDFATREKGWMVKTGISEPTLEKYQQWLANKYETINDLNRVYGTTYADFGAARAGLPFPVPVELRGGPVWYDWCRFNMDRVTDWFAFLKEGVHRYDPAKSPTSIKIIGGSLLMEYHDSGLDLEQLVKLQDMPGYDFKLAPVDAHNIRQKDVEWKERYAYDWRYQTFMLDFSKSLCPEKPVYDSEWHGFSEGKWFKKDLDRDYIHSALWMAFTHGMSAIEAWVWGRNEKGEHTAKDSFFAKEATAQPVALDSFGRTIKELNAHADDVVAMLPKKREFMIFYSEESAIQDGSYIKNLKAVYEAVKMLNLNVGFTTPSEISTLSADQILIVPPTPFISEQAFQRLQQVKGKVVLVEKTGNFAQTELGKSNPRTLQAFAAVKKERVYPMADALAKILEPLAPELPVKVTIKDFDRNRAYGVIVRQIERNGAYTVALMNLSKEKRNVVLETEIPKSWMNVITGRSESSVREMKPNEVLLLRSL